MHKAITGNFIKYRVRESYLRLGARKLPLLMHQANFDTYKIDERLK